MMGCFTMQTTVTVRPAGPHDVEFCKNIDTSLHHLKKYDASIEILMQMELILIAEFRGQLAGYLRMEHIFLELPYISWITVLPEFRRKGVAKMLLDTFIERKKAEGARYVLSSAEPESKTSTAWHKQNGFYEIGTLKQLNLNGADETFFRLDIGE